MEISKEYLPEGWELVGIGQVAEVIAGQSPKSKFYNTDKEGLPFYQGKKEFKEKYLGPESVWTSQITKEAFEGDILMSVRAPVGPVNVATKHLCIGRGLAAIRVWNNLDREYCFYFLKCIEHELTGSSGAVFNSINKKQIGQIQIPLPPLPTQRAIVARLDAAFARIDRARANLERNVENARELFQAKLNEVFSRRGEGWEEKPLKEICTLVNGKAYKRAELLQNGKYPVLRVGNLFTGKQWYYSDLELRPDKYVDNGDLIYAWSASFGPRIWEGGKVIYHYHIWKVIPKPKLVNKQFLYHMLDWDTEQIKTAHGTGTTMMHVGKGSMEARTLPVPPLQEQVKIVEEIDHLHQIAIDLEKHYQHQLTNLTSLKQSLLQKAFRGELIAEAEAGAVADYD